MISEYIDFQFVSTFFPRHISCAKNVHRTHTHKHGILIILIIFPQLIVKLKWILKNFSIFTADITIRGFSIKIIHRFIIIQADYSKTHVVRFIILCDSPSELLLQTFDAASDINFFALSVSHFLLSVWQKSIITRIIYQERRQTEWNDIKKPRRRHQKFSR